ncbi:uncharacterized protein LOC121033207 [Herpailurus yagouaroundi]|uniref:uncharacterized protein LOC121033207 n=1 Tax=Herpailurus yagouaroundi TaxID=1608482 RepID=UPI001AD607BA|nr:uncharacterized protein LOC121033207 [Puma yagouaroundi]
MKPKGMLLPLVPVPKSPKGDLPLQMALRFRRDCLSPQGMNRAQMRALGLGGQLLRANQWPQHESQMTRCHACVQRPSHRTQDARALSSPLAVSLISVDPACTRVLGRLSGPPARTPQPEGSAPGGPASFHQLRLLCQGGWGQLVTVQAFERHRTKADGVGDLGVPAQSALLQRGLGQVPEQSSEGEERACRGEGVCQQPEELLGAEGGGGGVSAASAGRTSLESLPGRLLNLWDSEKIPCQAPPPPPPPPVLGPWKPQRGLWSVCAYAGVNACCVHVCACVCSRVLCGHVHTVYMSACC